MITFSEEEIKAMQENPDVLRALADYHDCQYSEAEAIESGLGLGNYRRSEELVKAAEEIEAGY